MERLSNEQKNKIKTLIIDWFGEKIISDDDWEIFIADVDDIIGKRCN